MIFRFSVKNWPKISVKNNDNQMNLIIEMPKL